MNVLYVAQDGRSPSGVATYGRLVARHLANARLLLLNTDSAPSADAAEVVVETARSHDPARVAEAMRAALVPSRPTVILPNTGDTPWEAVRLLLAGSSEAERRDVRVLGIVHSDSETQYALAERFLPIAPLWIGVSRRCAEELRRRVGARGARVEELEYPVELDPTKRRTANGPLRLAYVGRLEEPQKRVSRLVGVFSGLQAAGVDFLATVAGDGPAREAFGDALWRAGDAVVRRVSLVGPLDRAGVAALWRSHEVCLLVSAYEGLPLALLEAMSAGACPVVMAVESGLPELLEDGRNARVVAQGDVDGMVAVLGRLARDPGSIVRLGAAARETVRVRFAPERHFARLAAGLRSLWTLPPPDPSRVAPDPTGAAVASIVARLCARRRPVAVFGAGMFGRKVVEACFAAGLEVVALVDSDPGRRGLVHRGLCCGRPEELPGFPRCVVAIGSLQFADEMACAVRECFLTRGVPPPEMVAAEA